MVRAGAIGDVAVVKSLLDKHVDFTWKTEKAFTAAVHAALLSSIRFGHVQLAGQLMQHLVDIEDDEACFSEALTVASKYGHTHVVQLLIEKRHTFQNIDDIALEWAASNGHVDVMRLLIQHGANVHAHDDCALRLACDYDEPGAMRLLIQHDPDGFAESHLALRQASFNGYADVVQLLL